MTDFAIPRRTMLLLGTGALAAARLEALQHAHEASQSGAGRVEFFSQADAADLEALAAAVIPSDDTPGAREAGVIFFIDRALMTFDRDKRELYSHGLAATQVKGRELFPGAPSIAALSAEQVDSLVKQIESTPFFEALRTHVIMGFLASPEWGGNREKAGWKVIGFDDAAAFQPPFGYYDRPENVK